MYTVMGSKSEQLLARLVNVMKQARKENEESQEHEGDYSGVSNETAQRLADTLNDAEDYLRENEQFVDRLAARGDLS